MSAFSLAAARLGWQPRFFNPKLGKWLHRVDVPTHVVWGAEDRVVAPAYADEFAQRIAKSRVEMIDGAGHLPHLEQSDRVARAMRDFLN